MKSNKNFKIYFFQKNLYQSKNNYKTREKRFNKKILIVEEFLKILKKEKN